MEASTQWKTDMERQAPEVGAAVALAMTREKRLPASSDDFALKIRLDDAGYFVAESDIGGRFGLDEAETRHVLEQGFLAVGDASLRLAFMKEFNAVTGMRQGELPVLGMRLDFLTPQLGADAQEARLRRVIEIAGLPDLSVAVEEGDFDVERFLQVRGSRECQEFRQWLRSLDSASDAEVRDRVESLRARLGTMARSGEGKVIRFLAGTGAGFVPIVGLALGPALGALDAFLVDRVLPESSPITFLGRLYPSLFK
jgi:hypothetical protein